MRRRPLSFRGRLTLRWTAGFGALLAVTNLAIYVGTASFQRRDLDAQLRTLAATELASSVDEYRGVHIHEFPAGSLAGGEYADKLAQLLTADGRVLHALPSSLAATPLLDAAHAQGVAGGATLLLSRTVLGRPARVTALRTAKDGVPYVLAVGLFTDRLEASLSHLAWLLVAVWALGLVLTAGLGFLLASRALGPIDRITARATEIADGDFSARLDPPAVDDEIGRMTRLLNEMIDRLRGALEANRRFASDASHELRSPLTVMQGEIDVALKRERTEGEYRETLALLRDQAGALRRLTEDLILLARAQEGRLQAATREVPLAPAVEEACARAAPLAAQRRVTLSSSLDGLVAYADPGLLARVLDNLLQNAVRYNRDGGSVRVTGEAEPSGAGWNPGYVRILVADTGIGLAEEDRERVFERFYRVDRSRSRKTGGTGLGLPICREILTLLRGEIRVARSSPAGSTFEIRLPGRAGPLGS